MLCELEVGNRFEEEAKKVLILVLMEYALREDCINSWKLYCYSVLILVLMEYALRGT